MYNYVDSVPENYWYYESAHVNLLNFVEVRLV